MLEASGCQRASRVASARYRRWFGSAASFGLPIFVSLRCDDPSLDVTRDRNAKRADVTYRVLLLGEPKGLSSKI